MEIWFHSPVDPQWNTKNLFQILTIKIVGALNVWVAGLLLFLWLFWDSLQGIAKDTVLHPDQSPRKTIRLLKDLLLTGTAEVSSPISSEPSLIIQGALLQISSIYYSKVVLNRNLATIWKHFNDQPGELQQGLPTKEEGLATLIRSVSVLCSSDRKTTHKHLREQEVMGFKVATA